ncbi:MAG TPA: chemotaxis protein CheA [Gammaproteobacteria bacterium]|nr:chemotaxis protein CheA [Gammaproteobacteria bacterium]
MSIDLSQFLETFYEESFEGLETMEQELLNLESGNTDPEVINTIFRAAHSIKGGSGTFGLDSVADYTHVLETLLDEMRDGRRAVTPEVIAPLLGAVDVLRDMLTALRAGEEPDPAPVAASRKALEAVLGQAGGEADEPAAGDNGKAGAGSGWRIVFRPHVHMLQTGNDPVRMFRELADLGELEVQADVEQLPSLACLVPEDSYLGWTLILRGDVGREAIDEVFDWVEGDCDLVIEPLNEGGEAPAPKERVTATPKAATAAAPASSATDAKPASQTGVRTARPAETSSIRVAIDKIDDLINMMGELVITQSMLSQLGEAETFGPEHIERLRDGLAQLERNTRELQENVMRIRMLPISFAFQRFPRLVHDLGARLGKKIELQLSGEQTELDKTVMEKIGDPLVHLVRNSLDHGIETPEARLAAGKPETGVIHLNAFHEGGNIVIEIRDDGAGLNRERILAKAVENGLVDAEDHLTDEQVYELIFAPGFSTAETVSDVSGRGVGMDVVRKNIRALGGTVDVRSEPGQGSTFTIRLPLTLAILDGQSVRVGQEIYIVPLIAIIESLQVEPEFVKSVTGSAQVYCLRDEYIPIVRLADVFGVQADARRLEDGLLVVVESEGNKIALFVDDLLGQQQVVIKSLETNFRKVDGISGATILGDGTVALILDITGLIGLARQQRTGNPDTRAA